MNYFPIIQALCRAAMADASPALRKQVERLRDALAKDGDSKQAGALTSLLTAADRAKEIAPNRIARSRAQLPGEVLSRNTPIPVDRDKIGRASCRERVCQYVEISVFAGKLKKTK